MAQLPADRRIVLVGPMPPHRGGIAQYGLRLHKALERICRVTTFAFKRQYPAWLYPGQSDIGPGEEHVTEGDVRYALDSLNPLSWLRVARSIVRLHPDALVIQWWTVFWWPAFMVIARLARRSGIPVILLCHNVVDHERAGWKQWLSHSMLALADGYVVHSSEHAAHLATAFPRRPIMQAPIPAYDDHPRGESAPIPSRGRLDLLFFGFLRPYKGVDVLLDALDLLDDPDLHLTVAGEAWDDCRTTVERLRESGHRNIETHLEFVPAGVAAQFFERADALVLPYVSASGSAVTALAYSFDKPVIASRVGGLIDAVEEGRTGIFFEAGNAQDLADVLRNLDRAKLSSMAAHVADYRARHGWSGFAAALARLAVQVSRPPRSGVSAQ